MPQINLHVTPTFEEALRRLMRLRSFRSKSEAIRLVVQEAADAAQGRSRGLGFADLHGIARPDPDQPPLTDDMLWEGGDLGGR